MAKISIALCTYNGEQFLREQLESFTYQRRLPDELIVCDDRSTDGTVSIVERFASQGAFSVVLVRNDVNLGSTRNFEKAISMCTGDLIFLSDQDDIWLPEKIERIEGAFDDEHVGLVFSDAEVVDEELRPLGRRLSSLTFHATSRNDLRAGMVFESLLKQNFVTGASAAFRSSLRNVITPTPVGVPNLIHDAWIALSIAIHARIIFIDAPLIKYRQHASQQIGLGIPHMSDRRESFERTIAYLHDDINRLAMMRDILPGLLGGKPLPSVDALIREKRDHIRHCEARMDLPRSRVKRVVPVLTEILSGRYSRFSAGLLSAAKDVVGDR
jgi:glycosyltransferase involved in cell wall biosynthesis